MRRDMVRMSMADEDFLGAKLGFVWIHPQTQLRKVQAAVVKFESQE
jgi:hypothetical protein